MIGRESAAEGDGVVSTDAGLVAFAPGSLSADMRPQVLAALAQDSLSARLRAGGWLDVAVAVVWFLATYAVLVLVSLPWWCFALAVVSMGLATTAMLTNVVHPLLHHSVGRSSRANAVAVRVLAPLGVSWRWWTVKHNLGHHGFPSIAGHDPDFDQAPLFRFDSPDQRRAWHHWQHVYAWFLYPFLTLRFILAADLAFIVTGREKGRQIETASWRRTLLLLLEKIGPAAVLLTPAFLLHRAVDVVGVVVIVLMVNGLSTVLIFLPGHLADDRTLSSPDHDGLIATDRVTTLMQAVTNTRVHNPVSRWFMSGLDHHIEHHLFPWVAHHQLRRIAPIVEDMAMAHGLPYRSHPSLIAGWRGHGRRLRAFGRGRD